MSETRLFVSGLCKTATDQDLYDMFSRYGEVVSAKA
jgi:RNA recognition motif-containing protein